MPLKIASGSQLVRADQVSYFCQSFFFIFLGLLIFLPSINFSLTTAEIFPYGILFFLFYKARLYPLTLTFIIAIFTSYLWGVWVWQAWKVDFVRSTLAYLNALLAFYVVINLAPDRLVSLRHCLMAVFFGLIFLGFLQVTGVASKLGFNVLLDLLMRRGAEGVVGSGRGVSLLSSEPSRAGYELIFMYAALRATSKNWASHKWLWGDLFLTLFLTLVIRSATGLAFWLVYLVGVYRLLVVLPGIIVGLVGFAWVSQIESRALSLLVQVFSQSSIVEIGQLLLNASGFRGISVVGAYSYGALNPLGAGVGFWHFSSVEAMKLTGIAPNAVAYFVTHHGGVYTPVRPTSYAASLFMDIGYAAIPFLTAVLMKMNRAAKTRAAKALVLLFAFYLFVLSAVGNPVPWVCLALLVGMYARKNL